MGLLAGYFAFRPGIAQHMRLFLTTGILGGFTTFSAFSLDTALLVERHAYGLAARLCCRLGRCERLGIVLRPRDV